LRHKILRRDLDRSRVRVVVWEAWTTERPNASRSLYSIRQ